MSNEDRQDAQLTPEQLRLMNAYELLTGDAPPSAAVDGLSEQEQLQLQEYVDLSADIARVATSTEVAPRVRDEIFAMAARRRTSIGEEQPWWAAWLRPAPIAAFGLAAALLFAVSVRPPSAPPVDDEQGVRTAPSTESMVALQNPAQPSVPVERKEVNQQVQETPPVQKLESDQLATVASPSLAPQPLERAEVAAEPVAKVLQAKGGALDTLRRKRSKSRVRPKRAIAAKPASLGPTKARKMAARTKPYAPQRTPMTSKVMEKLLVDRIQVEPNTAAKVQGAGQANPAQRPRSRAKRRYQFDRMPVGNKGSNEAYAPIPRKAATESVDKASVTQSLSRLRDQVTRAKDATAKRRALLRLLQRAKTLKDTKMIRWASSQLKAMSATKAYKR